MSLFDKIFGSRKERINAHQTFELLNGYRPAFHTWGGEIYESELVRAAIDARARHISKLAVETFGSARPDLQSKLALGPNEWQTWSQFLYRLSTIRDVQNNAIIVPVIDQYGITTGLTTVLPHDAELREYQGRVYLCFKFSNGQSAAVEFDRCAVLPKFQYKSDIWGETNRALHPTMELIDVQNQGIEEGVKSAATYRFMATVNNFSNEEDLAKERARFSNTNMQKGGGVLLWPNNYRDIKQIDSKPYVVDADQMKMIRENVFDYFGVNEDVLQNKTIGDAWSAFYEGAIEPFAVQLSEALTKMLFTVRERQLGSGVIATANRLQYMSNKDKLEVSAQMLDRGIFSLNEVRQIWNLGPVDGGDVRIIRGEYYTTDEKVADAAEGGTDGQN